jgi:hypothetical protein
MSTNTDRPHRMTLSQVVEKLLERGSSEHSSVTLSRNAKGNTQIEVVVRASENSSVTSVEEAEAVAVSIYERLAQRYPNGDESGGAA